MSSSVNEQHTSLAHPTIEESNDHNLTHTAVNQSQNPNHATLHQPGTHADHDHHTSRHGNRQVGGEHATAHDLVCHSCFSTTGVWDLLLSCIPASFTRRSSATAGNGPERPRPTRRLTKTRRTKEINLTTFSDPGNQYDNPIIMATSASSSSDRPPSKRNRLRSRRRPTSAALKSVRTRSKDLKQNTHSNIPTRVATNSSTVPRHQSSSRESLPQAKDSSFLHSLWSKPRPPLEPFLVHLPDDILRGIFEYAAYDDTDTACALVLVASHVKEWVDPILYSVVRLEGLSQIRLFARTVRGSFDSEMNGTASRPRTPIDLASSMPHLPLPPPIPYAQPRRSISIDSLRPSTHAHTHYTPPSSNRQRLISDRRSPRIVKRPSFFKHVRCLAILPQEQRVLLFFRDALRDAILIMSACINVVELETTGDFLRQTNVARASVEISGTNNSPAVGGDGESVHTTPTPTLMPTPGTSTPTQSLAPQISFNGQDQVGAPPVLAPAITSPLVIGGGGGVNAVGALLAANMSGSSVSQDDQQEPTAPGVVALIQPMTPTNQPMTSTTPQPTILSNHTLVVPSRLEDASLRPRYLTLVPPTLNVNFRLAILSKVSHLHYSVELPRALNVFGVGEGLLSGSGFAGVGGGGGKGELTHVAFDYPLGVMGVKVETLLMLVRSALDVGKRLEYEMDDERANTPRPLGDEEDEDRQDERDEDENEGRGSSLDEEHATTNGRGRMLEMVVVRVLLRPRMKESDRTGQVWRQLADLSARDERLVFFESAGLFGEDVWEMAQASVAQRERLSASWYRESP